MGEAFIFSLLSESLLESKIKSFMMHMQSVRAFIAIDPDNETRQRLLTIQREVLKMLQFSSVKVVDPLAMHVTLSFFGNIAPPELSAIRDALRSVSFHPFCVTLNGIGAFPNIKKMRVIHVGLSDSADLRRLHKLIIESLGEAYESDKEFDPHITLGRVKRAIPSEMRDLANVMAPLSSLFVGRLNVSSFLLKQSTLTPKGPIYDTLEEFKL
jgi:2'-5' RNA ligase